jgi:hypothetical protein
VVPAKDETVKLASRQERKGKTELAAKGAKHAKKNKSGDTKDTKDTKEKQSHSIT